MFETFLPEVVESEESRELWAKVQRLSASRGLALEYYEQMLEMDSREALGSISVPTLVLQGSLDAVLDPGTGRATAAAIPGATFRQVPCGHIPWIAGGDEVVLAVQEFATGAAPARRSDRRLATVLFTDIVDSTARASSLGDRAWRSLLERHDAVVRDQIDRFGGREVKATGDGFLAVFDGPTEAIDCARAARAGAGSMGVTTRAGLHMGQCEFRGDDLAGIAVHIGARVAALAGPGEILVSRTVRDLVIGSDIEFEDRGEHVLKGIPDPWRVFSVA
jgi:class 3 adenylate cyclase